MIKKEINIIGGGCAALSLARLIRKLPNYKFNLFIGNKLNNLLKNEKSPYLKQHENNPVHWFPWNKHALEKAKELKKPIFLSVGYSSCHWCHVMAHESFEDKNKVIILM